jgi:hypothetical protein
VIRVDQAAMAATGPSRGATAIAHPGGLGALEG